MSMIELFGKTMTESDAEDLISEDARSLIAALRDKCAALEKDVQVAKGQYEGACIIIKQLEEKCAELELKLLNCEDESKSGFYRGLSEELQAKLDEAAGQKSGRMCSCVECVGNVPDVPEPDGWLYESSVGADVVRHRLSDGFKAICPPDMQEYQLYRHPPNLPAIIEQAKAEEREACAKICEAMNPFVVINGERWNKNGDGALFRLLDVAPNLERMHMNKLAFEGRSVEDEHNEHPVQKCAAAIRARKP